MIPVATFLATAVVTNAPARFATDAINTAIRGESARVLTDVAIAFAVSWNPLVKSKPSATTTTRTNRTSFTTTPLAVSFSGRAGFACAPVGNRRPKPVTQAQRSEPHLFL